MNPLVEFDAVSMSHGHEPVFHDVSFALDAEEHLALLGASGCGKSTLLSLLAGLIHPTSGCIRMTGQTVSSAGKILVPPHRRGLAMVFQDLALWPNLSALDNVVFGAPRDFGLKRSERIGRAKEMLALCGIEKLAARKPAALSSGQQQRVALARALTARPRLLLLDEPFTGLDLLLKQQLLYEIRSRVKQFAITVVLVSHDPWEVRHLCRHGLVIEENTVVEQGKLDDLLCHPASATMRAMAGLLGSRRQLPGEE